MTTIKVDKITPGSGTTTTLGDSGDTFTIPSGVTLANSGSSNLGDQVTYCTSTKSASFTAVANKGYFINTSDASPFLNYAVTVASGTLYSVGGTGNAYFLDGSRNMALTLLKGRTYRFTQTDNTNDSHPLIISTSNSTTLSTFIAGIVSSGVSYYLDGASTQSNYINTTPFNAATTRYIEFQPQTTGTFYFGCYIHGVQMGGAITSQELTVTLPSSPTVGTEMIIIDSSGNASTNNITIGRGGSKIKGACSDVVLTTDRIGVRLIYSDASQGWVTVTSANENAPTLSPLGMTATGGTITTSGDYKIHTFTSDATFSVSSLSPVPANNIISYMVVAGGGAGGKGHGGGGGAGGFREGKSSSDSYTASPLNAPAGITVTASDYPITIGGGGAGSPGTGCGTPFANNSGSNSVFSTITSAGGGKAAGWTNAGATGGSGGGGGGPNAPTTSGYAGNTPPVSPSQGSNGGNGNNPGAGGGGGGATATGSNASSPGPNANGGNGGAGATTSISASPTAYAGGGGGGNYFNPGTGGTGGTGGGGNGATTPPTSAVAGSVNTGGGGGGGGANYTKGEAGGSGVVIIRYKYQ